MLLSQFGRLGGVFIASYGQRDVCDGCGGSSHATLCCSWTKLIIFQNQHEIKDGEMLRLVPSPVCNLFDSPWNKIESCPRYLMSDLLLLSALRPLLLLWFLKPYYVIDSFFEVYEYDWYELEILIATRWCRYCITVTRDGQSRSVANQVEVDVVPWISTQLQLQRVISKTSKLLQVVSRTCENIFSR